MNILLRYVGVLTLVQLLIFSDLVISLGAEAVSNGEVAGSTVTASGQGIDAAEALQNALKAAVEQAVGILVDAQTIVINEKQIEEEILTFSSGYVERYDKVTESKAPSGIVNIKIRAVVRRDRLLERLKSNKPASALVSGANLFAEVKTKEASAVDATEMLKRELKELTLGLLEASVTTNRPVIVPGSTSEVRARWVVTVRSNVRMYQTNAMLRLKRILDLAAIRKQEISTKSSEVIYMSSSTLFSIEKLSTQFARLTNPNTEGLLALETGRNGNGSTRNWTLYVLDQRIVSSLQTMTIPKRLRLQIALLGDSDDVIATDFMAMSPDNWQDRWTIKVSHQKGGETIDRTIDTIQWMFRWVDIDEHHKTPMLVVSPGLQVNLYFGDGHWYANSFGYYVHMDLAASQLQQIQKFQCCIVEESNP